MPLDDQQTQRVLQRLGDELEKAAHAAAPSWPLREPFKVERDARKVRVSRFYTVEVSVSGEKECVETTFITGDDRRPETRNDPIPGDASQFQTLASELIQPLMHGR